MNDRTLAKTLTWVAVATIAVLSAQMARPVVSEAVADDITPGAVYTMTNDPINNEILAYRRASNGTLWYLAAYSTDGRGSGGAVDPLQSQDSLLLSDEHRFLFAANAASGTITAFQVYPGGRLKLASVTPSGGAFPVSLTEHGDLLFVLNASGGGNITGFHIGRYGGLTRIPGATRPLSSANPGASTIAFSPDGQTIVASERGTNNLDTFSIEPDGTAFGPVLTTSNSPTPFSLTFTSGGYLLVTEPPTGSVSSYSVAATDSLSVITGSVSTGYKAACWIVATRDGAHAFVADAGSGEISELAIDGWGNTTVTGAAATATGAAPLDLALSGGDHYLYALTAGAGTITEYSNASGLLTEIGTIGATPAASGQNGIAAF